MFYEYCNAHMSMLVIGALEMHISGAYPRFKSGGRIMARARNEAPKAPRGLIVKRK